MEKNELNNILKQLQVEFNEAEEMLMILREYFVFPELPIIITKMGLKNSMNVPLSERQNMLHFLLVCWQREKDRSEYLINKIKAQDKQEREYVENDL